MPQHTTQEICHEMVTRIARLANLRLTPEEAEQYQKDFTGLLEMFEELEELGFDPEYQPEKFFMNAEDCREDIVHEVDNTDLDQASPYYNKTTSYFDVPQFIGNQDE